MSLYEYSLVLYVEKSSKQNGQSMKPKKPYSGKYPVLFYQPAANRLRIFHPDGYSEWSAYREGVTFWFEGCCYGTFAVSLDELIVLANCYDKKACDYPPMEFIGEIK